MPGGMSDPIAGYATFAVVKLAGYSVAGYVLGKAYSQPRANAAVSGLTRTVIGLVVGAAYGSAMALLATQVGAAGLVIFLVGLVPVRLGEWRVLLWLYYDRALAERRKDWGWATAGTAWSFVLDVPALFGAIVTAGVWIC